MWVDTADLPTNDGHPYFERLNRVLADSGFDAFVEELCAAFYADRLGRPSLRPGRYFRMLFIGYFEGLSSERGIAWRVADSLSLRSFLDLELTEAAPDHSTLSRTRIPVPGDPRGRSYSRWMVRFWSGSRAAAGLRRGAPRGRTVRHRSRTTLEANAAMRSMETVVVMTRRDHGRILRGVQVRTPVGRRRRPLGDLRPVHAEAGGPRAARSCSARWPIAQAGGSPSTLRRLSPTRPSALPRLVALDGGRVQCEAEVAPRQEPTVEQAALILVVVSDVGPDHRRHAPGTGGGLRTLLLSTRDRSTAAQGALRCSPRSARTVADCTICRKATCAPRPQGQAAPLERARNAPAGSTARGG